MMNAKFDGYEGGYRFDEYQDKMKNEMGVWEILRIIEKDSLFNQIFTFLSYPYFCPVSILNTI